MSNREVTPYVDAPSAGGPNDTPRIYTRREIFVRRVLFWLGILAFVAVASIPLLLVLLSMMGDFVFDVPGDFPNDEARVWMVMEPRERGVAYSVPGVVERTADTLRVETTVRYLLWEGTNEFIQYCQTYTRADENAAWAAAEMSTNPCNLSAS